MKILISQASVETLRTLADRFRNSLPRIIFILKMPKDGAGPVVGFVPPDFLGEIQPLSEIAGLKIYVDEPQYVNSVLTGKYLDAVDGSFLVRGLMAADKQVLLEVEIFEGASPRLP